MIDFKVEFVDSKLGVVESPFITGFSYTTRLYSIYSVAKIIFKDLSKEAFNELKVGADVNIYFYDTEDSSISYLNPMKIKSFQKEPATAHSLKDVMSVELISSWYYLSDIQTAHYFGNVGTIIAQIFGTYFNNLGYKFNFTSTSDKSKSRYQIYKRPQAFIEWLVTRGIKNDYPVYLYTDHKGCVNLVGYDDILKNENFWVAEVLGATQATPSARSLALGIIDLTQYMVLLNPSYSSIQGIHTTANYYNPNGYPQDTTLLSCEATGLGNNAKKNIQIAETSPIKVEITPWYECPMDARAEFLSENWATLSQTFKVRATAPELLLEPACLGNLIRLELPFEAVQNPTTGEMLNFAEGGYIVDTLVLTCSGTKKTTTFEMFQVRF